MKPSSIVLRICFSLSLITASLIFLAHTFGFLPDAEKAELKARSNIAEALAIQLISAASKNDIQMINFTIGAIVKRNNFISSIALRKADGKILSVAGEHNANWVDIKDNVSTPTHVQVPILNGLVNWGVIEIVFVPLPTGVRFFGVPSTILILIAFLGLTGLIGNYIVLKRSLKVLDPSGVVPERVQKAFDTLAEGVLIIDENEQILLTNSSFAGEINFTVEQLLGKPVANLPWKRVDDSEVEFPWTKTIKKGEPVVGAAMHLQLEGDKIIKFTVNATPVSNAKGDISGAIVTFDDVTALEFKNIELNKMVYQLKETEIIINKKNSELHQLATRDPLTDCFNRRAFFEAFDAGIENAKTSGEQVFCMMMDLDHFKNVNDTYGHGVGDEVIVMLGDILKATCTGTDVAGRYGGEEFCVALFGIDENACYERAEKIRLAVMKNSMRISALNEPVTTSIGISRVTDDIFKGNDLLAEADKALYAAKENGRNCVVDCKNLSLENGTTAIQDHNTESDKDEYQSAGNLREISELSLEEKVRSAIKLNDFCLHYQPIIDLQRGHVNSVEVLLRCNNKALLDQSIQSLVNVAEKSGLIIELGEWVLLNALKQYRIWLDEGIELPKISVNISPVQLSDPVASVRIQKIIRHMDIDPCRLQLEITESAMMENTSLAKQTLSSFQELGVSIAIDDFGTGHSSISYFKKFNPDVIKIDQSYVEEIIEVSPDNSLVSSIIAMAHKQGSKVVAEGVETNYQLDQLVELHCDYIQGYLISRPLDSKNMSEWLSWFVRRMSDPDQTLDAQKIAAEL